MIKTAKSQVATGRRSDASLVSGEFSLEDAESEVDPVRVQVDTLAHMRMHSRRRRGHCARRNKAKKGYSLNA